MTPPPVALAIRSHRIGPAIARLLSQLVGQPVAGEIAPAWLPGPLTPSAVGVYGWDASRFHSIVIVDLWLATAVAAGMQGLSLADAKALIADAKGIESVYEDLRACMRTFFQALEPTPEWNLRLLRVHHVPPRLPSHMGQLIEKTPVSESYRIGVGAYGAGRMAIMRLA